MLQALRKFVTHNLGIKLASLILALAIYAHVLSSEDRESVFSVPLEVVGLPEGLTYEGTVPSRIQVRVEARGTELWKLHTQSLRAEIDLGEARPGMLQRPVTTEDVVLPPGADAQIKSIVRPVVLSLQVEPLVSRPVPVSVRFRGGPDPGTMRTGRATAEPETVRVEGPKTRVEALDSLRTEGIALIGRSHPLEARVRVVHPEGVWLAVDSVTVQVPIERVEQRSFGPVRVLLTPVLGSAWRAEPESVRVIVEGPVSWMEGVQSRDMTARIHVRTAPDSTVRVPVQAVLGPKFARLVPVGTDPDSVTIRRRAR
ncbi:MAG: YbbR-like domain-containing protein [Candidatus Eisenbacteria bacterium]|uniref:YbbR-like domain-containing protein n=1 Tax=Eiseniibacteriota bacterium TaxID=2212470 RepID=A0A956RR07_UNCEI|nr:YbbR-like domain-containing protein [Candidatus Eisenbacteria bacterium]